MATVDLLVTLTANRSHIHDEVSTILRGIKCKDITVQMTGPNVPSAILSDHSHSSKNKLITNTEDDLYAQPTASTVNPNY